MVGRKIRWVVAIVLACAVLAGAPGRDARALGPVLVLTRPSTPAFAPSWANTAIKQDAPDPDVVRFGTTYFAYTTGTVWGNHIGVLRSSSPNRGYNTITGNSFGSSAFPAGQVVHWQVANTQHAPGVFQASPGHYVMYYDAQTAAGHGGRYCLSVATATNPAGPFVDRTTSPWLCRDADCGTIDPSPLASGGQKWLYFKTYDDACRSTQPAQIFAVHLSADGLTPIGAPVLVLSQRNLSSPFETVENPQMIQVGSAFMLQFSRGQWNSSSYRVGYAVCASVIGPCTEAGALLTSYGNVLGPGGSTVFSDATGRSWLAYQGWNGAPGCTAYNGTSCARKLYVASLQLKPTPVQVPCHAVSPVRGYRFVASDGGVFAFGNEEFCGSAGSISLGGPIVGMAATPDRGGYWLAATDGEVCAFGDANFRGCTDSRVLQKPIVGVASTRTGKGYWLVAADGGIFSFGDARFHGSTGAIHLNQRIVGMAATPSGNGYWFVAADGGIFAFGDARFYGSTGAIHLNQPIVGMAPTRTGRGYWFVAADGGIFAFGDARFYGSTGAIHLNQPIVGMAATPSGKGYWFVAADGGIFAFGDARFYGSTPALKPGRRIVGMS